VYLGSCHGLLLCDRNAKHPKSLLVAFCKRLSASGMNTGPELVKKDYHTASQAQPFGA
jgi:hypothetical protein